jgi:hypothetical protein
VSELVRYDAMCRAIDAAFEVDEVKAIHDQAQMLQAAARVAKNTDAETRAYEIRMRAARKAGQILRKAEKSAGGRPPKNSGDEPQSLKSDVLEKAGVKARDASDWERLSEVSEDDFEAALPTMSVRDLIDKPTPVSDDALLFIGTMRDFERRGYLASTPGRFMATMVETMLEEVYRIAPLASAWLATIKRHENG